VKARVTVEGSATKSLSTKARQRTFDKQSEDSGRRDRYFLEAPEFREKAVLGTKSTFGNLDPNEFSSSGLVL
jgi:hypothetical protein